MPRFELILLPTVLLASVTVKNACAAPDTDFRSERYLEDEKPAEAEEAEESSANEVWNDRRLSLAAQLGVATPLGLIGLEAEYAPLEWLSFGGGIGRTLTGNFDWGTEAGLWVTPRVVFDASAIGVDLGMSTGPYDSLEVMDEHAPWQHHPRALWFNAGARYQYLSDGGVLFKTFAGVATLTNPGYGYCDDGEGSATDCDIIVLGYFGVALGFAFSTDS